jgi:hypothetical protein
MEIAGESILYHAMTIKQMTKTILIMCNSIRFGLVWFMVFNATFNNISVYCGCQLLLKASQLVLCQYIFSTDPKTKNKTYILKIIVVSFPMFQQHVYTSMFMNIFIPSRIVII